MWDEWIGIDVSVSVCGDGLDRGLQGAPAVITTCVYRKKSDECQQCGNSRFFVEHSHSVDDARFVAPRSINHHFCSRINAGGADKIDSIYVFLDTAALEKRNTMCRSLGGRHDNNFLILEATLGIVASVQLFIHSQVNPPSALDICQIPSPS